MSNWQRIKPLTRDEARKLAQMERMPKGVLNRDEQIKMERLQERRNAEDRRDAEIARQRLEELKNKPELLVTGEALRKILEK